MQWLPWFDDESYDFQQSWTFFCKWHNLQNIFSVMNKDEAIKKFEYPNLMVKIALV